MSADDDVAGIPDLDERLERLQYLNLSSSRAVAPGCSSENLRAGGR